MKRRQTPQLEPYTVLTTTELAEHFKVSARTVERWNIPSVAPGRYLFAHVLEWCHAQKQARLTA